jgi:hypothetical protein
MAACWLQKQQTSRLSDNVFPLRVPPTSPSFKINLTRRNINFHQEIYVFDTKPSRLFLLMRMPRTLKQLFSEIRCLSWPETFRNHFCNEASRSVVPDRCVVKFTERSADAVQFNQTKIKDSRNLIQVCLRPFSSKFIFGVGGGGVTVKGVYFFFCR